MVTWSSVLLSIRTCWYCSSCWCQWYSMLVSCWNSTEESTSKLWYSLLYAIHLLSGRHTHMELKGDTAHTHNIQHICILWYGERCKIRKHHLSKQLAKRPLSLHWKNCHLIWESERSFMVLTPGPEEKARGPSVWRKAPAESEPRRATPLSTEQNSDRHGTRCGR